MIGRHVEWWGLPMLHALMPDLMTALAMTGLAGGAAAWLIWLRGHRHHWHQGVPEAVAAALCSGLAYLVLAVQVRLQQPGLLLASQSLVSLGIACYTLALLRFSHRGSRLQALPLLLLPLALCGLLGWVAGRFAPPDTALAHGVLALLQLGCLLWVLQRMRGQPPTIGWRVVQVASLFQALGIVPLLSLTGLPLPAVPADGALAIGLPLLMWLACLLVFVHVIVHNVGFLMMLRDRQALVERELVERDSLTGLSNRPTLLAGLQEQMERSRSTGGPLAVLMVDIDHFKQLNDQHGHLAGDQVIRHTAGVLAEHARHGDLVGRYGGEEFVLVLPDTPLGQASAIAQRLCRSVRDRPLHLPGSAPLSVSVSIGVHVGVPGAHACWQQVLQAADAAMYRAKQDGRDRVALDT